MATATTTRILDWNNKWPVPYHLFERYEAVRESGVMNMLLLPRYDHDFTREHMICIMKHYGDMKKMYMDNAPLPESDSDSDSDSDSEPAAKKQKLSEDEDDYKTWPESRWNDKSPGFRRYKLAVDILAEAYGDFATIKDPEERDDTIDDGCAAGLCEEYGPYEADCPDFDSLVNEVMGVYAEMREDRSCWPLWKAAFDC